MLNLPALRSRGQSLSSRNDEVHVRNSGHVHDVEENTPMQEQEDQVNNQEVYYELSSSNNDVTESEEEDDHLACIQMDGNEVEFEEKDEFQELREKLAENTNFLHQTPSNKDVNFEAAK